MHISETRLLYSPCLMQGHVSTISCLSWSSDDTRLASVGAGGACYQWDIPGGVKIANEEYVDKQKNYCWVQFCGTGHAYGVIVRSLDGKLQHIQVVLHGCEHIHAILFPCQLTKWVPGQNLDGRL